MKITVNRNVFANYASRFWSGISIFIFVPAYLRILGPEAFGLVTFSTSILGIVFVLDMGMSNAFAREMARETDSVRLASLLRSLEWIYLGVVLLVLMVAVAASGPIADHWLNASRLLPAQVRWSVGLMLVAAILQVMMALYIGGLLGSNRHVAAASYQIAFGVARSGLVLVPIYFWPAVELVFVWQVAVSIVCLLLLRGTVWRSIAPPTPPRFSSSALRSIAGFAGGMFGIALISAVNTQSDKMVVSRVFSLDELGFYSIASLMGQIPSMLALPLAVTVLPRLTAHVARGEHAELTTLYMRYSFMIAVISTTAGICVAVGAPQILAILLGRAPSPELVAASRILSAGGALLAAQYMPYHLAIANGHTRTSILFGTLSAVLLPFVMFAGASKIGLLGAAIPWAVMNGIAAIYLAVRITPRFLGPHLAEWIWKANLLPAVIGAAIVLPAIFALPMIDSRFVAVFLLGLFGWVAIAANALLLFRLFREPSTVQRTPFEACP